MDACYDKEMWVVKYALTCGIEHKSGHVQWGNYFRVKGGFSGLRIGRDCFENREDAVKRANILRVKKIASLQKQLAEVEKMTFC